MLICHYEAKEKTMKKKLITIDEVADLVDKESLRDVTYYYSKYRFTKEAAVELRKHLLFTSTKKKTISKLINKILSRVKK